MSYSIFLDPRAIEDVKEAFDFYEERQEGLGVEFLEIPDQSLSILKRRPYFQIRYDEVRCLPLPRFPFLIHFSVLEDLKRVKVWAVLHTSRNPDEWSNPGN